MDTLPSVNQQTEYNYQEKRRGIPFLYYRLKIVEPGGTVRFSEVVKWREGLPDFMEVQLKTNPVTQDAILQVISNQPTSAILLIMDPSGKKLYMERLIIKRGEQSIPRNLSHLSAGVYILRLQGQGWNKTILFYKQ